MLLDIATSDDKFTLNEDIKNWVDSWITSKDEHSFRHDTRMLPENRKK